MHGREDECRGGAIAQQFVEKKVRHLAGMLRVGEALLGRKRVALEPFQQLLAVGGDDVGLRIMHVGVDEAGQKQLAVVVDHLRIRRQPREQIARGAELEHSSVAQDQQAVLEVAMRSLAQLVGVADEVQNGSAERLDPIGADCLVAHGMRSRGHLVGAPWANQLAISCRSSSVIWVRLPMGM